MGTKVVFEFESQEMADRFAGYMSDGGGEYMFIELRPESLDFDYNRKADGDWVVRVRETEE